MGKNDNVCMPLEELEVLLAKAAEAGARKALENVGLHDELAGKDLRELRDFLATWRDTRSTMMRTTVTVLTTSLLTFLAGAIWLKIKNYM